jgi:hypothetical protein
LIRDRSPGFLLDAFHDSSVLDLFFNEDD